MPCTFVAGYALCFNFFAVDLVIPILIKINEGCSKSKFPYFISVKKIQLEQIYQNMFIGGAFSCPTSDSFFYLDQRLLRY